MLKHKLKSMVEDRAPTKYPKSAVTVLQKLLEYTYVPDWRKSAVEDCFSRSMSIRQWAFHTNLHWNTVGRIFKTLQKDGVIILCEPRCVPVHEIEIQKHGREGTGKKNSERCADGFHAAP
jgi:hypothetical protein